MIGLPKPEKRTDAEKRVERLTKAWARKDRWRAKAIANAKGKPRPKVRERNEKRIARKAKAYRTVLASAFNRLLRYTAFVRGGGLCECPQCVGLRKGERASELTMDGVIAWTPIEVWFNAGGRAPHYRFHSTEGELHHISYKYFGDENPDEINQVIFVHKGCHRRIESEHGTRRRFLRGK